MTALRTTLRIIALAVPMAATTLLPGAAGAGPPPHPFGGPAITIGCSNQGSLMSLTAVTGETVAPGVIRFESHPAVFPVPAAGQVTVAWVNTNSGQAGITDLFGAYPNLSGTANTGRGYIVATAFGSFNLGSGPICNVNPTIGTFIG